MTASGPGGGLSVLLDSDIDDYFASAINSYGFEVMIHDSDDYPDMNAEINYIEANSEAYLSVTPEATYTEIEAVADRIDVKYCYDDDEIQLQVLRKYSYTNCMSECRRLIAFLLCKCVPHNYPRNGTFAICELDQMSCIFRNKRKFVSVALDSFTFQSTDKPHFQIFWAMPILRQM